MSRSERQIIVGAKALAARALNDPKRINSIYDAYARSELPIFKVGGKLHAYADDLDAAMREKELGTLEARERRREFLGLPRRAAEAAGGADDQRKAAAHG